MNHAEVRQKLSAYLDGEVSAEERMLIEEHLGSCPACDAALKELAKSVGHVRNLEEIEPPPWLAQKVMTRIREEAGRKRSIFSRMFLPLHIKLPVEAMALVLVTVTAYVVYNTVGPQVRYDEPARLEEYRQELPESAPVPSPAPAEKDRPQLKTGREAVPAPPLTRKPARTTDETDEYPASEPEFALPGAADTQPPAAIKKESDSYGAQSPAPSDAWQSEQFSPSAVPANEEKSRLKSKSVERQFEQSAKPDRLPISLKITTGEADSAAGEIEREISRLGGRMTRMESSATGRTMTVMIDARKLPALGERLRLIGEIKGSETPARAAGETGEVTVIIEIVQYAGK